MRYERPSSARDVPKTTNSSLFTVAPFVTPLLFGIADVPLSAERFEVWIRQQAKFYFQSDSFTLIGIDFTDH